MRDGWSKGRQRHEEPCRIGFPCSTRPEAINPLILLSTARNFAKIPCISLQIPVSAL